MTPSGKKAGTAPSRRRFVVQLLCLFGKERGSCRYIARIRPWSARASAQAETRERAFADEYDLVRTVNPLLAHGSDVRDVLDYIESPSGFFYLLYLSLEEAEQLGWRPDVSAAIGSAADIE